MKLYISDLSIYVLVFTYLPLVIYLLVRLLFNRNLSKFAKTVSIAVAIPIIYAIPFGDVTLNSMAMARACPQAGLHVYKKVKVDGYLDSSAVSRNMEKHGYLFMESYVIGGGYARHDLQEDGSIKETFMDKPTAEYEVVYKSYYRKRDGTFRMVYSRDESSVYPSEDNLKALPGGETRIGGMHRWQARNRITGEVIGEWITFGPLHGWLDRIFLNRLFGASLSGCSGRSTWPESDYSNFRHIILQPKKS
ncbi:MAG: hypothetical protein ABW148_09490 [Sedimenticola sp.]